MTQQQINYDSMVQAALLDVVRKLLIETSKSGLPGQHHFYIAFRTGHPGVRIPSHLMAKYPEEMTIVLQNQFWNLKVIDDRFEVNLSFNQKPETLVIPFAAITGFLDPSVEFGLQFQRPAAPQQNEPQKTPAATAAKPDAKPSTPAVKAVPAPEKLDQKPAGKSTEKPGEKVVTLDAFRKKK